MNEYRDLCKKLKLMPLESIVREGAVVEDGMTVKVGAIVSYKRLKSTRGGDAMAFVGLEDHTGAVEMLVFPKVLERVGRSLEVGRPAAVTARVSIREEEEVKLVCMAVQPLAEQEAAVQSTAGDKVSAAPGKRFDAGLWLKVPSQQDPVFAKVLNLLQIFEGTEAVHIFFEDTRRLVRNYPQVRVDMNNVLKNELVKLLSDKKVQYFPE